MHKKPEKPGATKKAQRKPYSGREAPQIPRATPWHGTNNSLGAAKDDGAQLVLEMSLVGGAGDDKLGRLELRACGFRTSEVVGAGAALHTAAHGGPPLTTPA
eukprot:scaffold110938_cov15-Tisochrysis_lutea.AAC.1